MKLYKKSSVSDSFETLIYFQIEPISDTRFATTSNDNIVRLFELPQVYTIRQYGSKQYVYALLFDQASQLLLVGNGQGTLEVLDLDYKIQKTLRLHEDLITCIKKAPKQENLLVTSSTDSTIKISKFLTTEILVKITLDQPIWSFLFYQDKIFVPMIQQSKAIKNFAKEPAVQVIEGKHRQMLLIDGKKLYATDVSFGYVQDLQTKQKIEIEADAISEFNGRLIILNNEFIGVHENGDWKKSKSPVTKHHTAFCAKQVGQFFVIGSDRGFVMVYEYSE